MRPDSRSDEGADSVPGHDPTRVDEFSEVPGPGCSRA